VPPALRLGWHRAAARLAERAARPWLRAPARLRALALLAVFAAGLLVSSVVLLRFHNSADEFAYVFQAETLASGRLWVDEHPLQAFVQFMHSKVLEGRWVSRFPPGWPAFLAPFLSLGLPAWLVNPLLAAACVALLYLLGRRSFGERAGLLAAALFAISPFLMLNAGAYYSHLFAALLSLIFAIAGTRYLERPSAGAALVAGLALGWLGLARTMNPVLLGAPFVVAVLARRSWPHLLRGWPLALGAGGFLALLLAYNGMLTGDPTLPPTLVDDPKQTIGFVGGHTPARAWKFIQHRLLLLPRYTSGLFLFVYLLALARGAQRRDLRWWDAYFLLEVLGYSLYHNSSHDTYGPRYLFEAFPFAALRIAAACAPRAEGRPWAPVFSWLVAVHLCMAVAGVFSTAWLHGQVIRERRDPIRLVEEAGLTNAVVFVASDTSPTRRMPKFDLVRNPPDVDRQAVVWAHFRKQELERIEAHYPQRTFWVYQRRPDQVRGRLVSLDQWRSSRTDPGA
jgi:4-amino-4-deoxy-L-arabinose transferase-like glycosyltransferase